MFRRAMLALVATCFTVGTLAAAGTASALAAGAAETSFGEDRLQEIVAAGLLRVCIWPDYYGITFRNPKSGKLSGLDVTLSAELARELGVALVHVDSSFTDLIDDLLSNRCDVAMFGVAIHPERVARVNFTQPYLRSDIWAVTTRTHPAVSSWGDIDKPGRVVAVQAGTFMEPVMKATLQHAELTSISPPETRERALRAGRVDVFMTDFPYSRRLLDNAPWAKVMPPERPIHPLAYAYAVAPGHDRWLARVDRFVADIKRDGRLLAAAREHRLEQIVVTP